MPKVKKEHRLPNGGRPSDYPFGRSDTLAKKSVPIRASGRACSVEGCEQYVKKYGVCTKHGGRTFCTYDGCTKQRKHNQRCAEHGAKSICKIEGCQNRAYLKGRCGDHGGRRKKYCKHEGCQNNAVRGGACNRHGGKKECSVEGCTHYSLKGGLCQGCGSDHIPSKCGFVGCSNQILKRGFCQRHGPKDEICGFLGCENQVIVRKRCVKCDRLIRQHGVDNVASVLKKNASEDPSICNYAGGCKYKAKIRGKCKRHIQFSDKDLDREYAANPPQPDSGTRRRAQRKRWDLFWSQNKEKNNLKYDLSADLAAKPQADGVKSDSLDNFLQNPLARGTKETPRRVATQNAQKYHIQDVGYSNSSAMKYDGYEIFESDERDDHPDPDHTEPPTHVVIDWVRSMSDINQQESIRAEMRVKVRFEGNLWYGGMVERVIDGGKRIQINFDDGTEEISCFPDDDIIVDDHNNGKHCVNAWAFVPMCIEVGEDDMNNEPGDVDGCSQPVRKASFGVLAIENYQVDLLQASAAASLKQSQTDTGSEDEDSGLDTLIYKSSQFAKVIQHTDVEEEPIACVTPQPPPRASSAVSFKASGKEKYQADPLSLKSSLGASDSEHEGDEMGILSFKSSQTPKRCQNELKTSSTPVADGFSGMSDLPNLPRAKHFMLRKMYFSGFDDETAKEVKEEPTRKEVVVFCDSETEANVDAFLQARCSLKHASDKEIPTLA